MPSNLILTVEKGNRVASYTVHCPQHLNITMVEGFKEALQAAVDKGGECHLNISLVEKIDSTGMQILVAFQNAMVEQGGLVKIKGSSDIFESTSDVLGITSLFERHA
jgi:anti-anti-sigma regulatory factor